ncbi:Oxidoreductase, short chain dehydrogenase/reductase family protein [Aphelenchoides besseyi]|nr:Oxidoreductase, short chain dehydrogenase/reductase family protein [Aphelenchoides besseyi]
MSIESRKTILLTGSNQGIGFATSCLLARQGYNIVIAGRNKERVAAACKQVQLENPEVTVSYVIVDFSSIDSAIGAAKQVVSRFVVDVIILNAGVLKPIEKHTAEEHSTVFQVNYLAQYFFAQLIIDGRQSKRPIRIISLTSAVHVLCGFIFNLPRGDTEKWLKAFDHSRGFWKRYSLSKFAMAVLPQLLHNKEENVVACAVNPGVVTETSLAHSISQSVRSRLSFLRGHFTSLDTAAKNVAFCVENEFAKNEYRNSDKLGQYSKHVLKSSNVNALAELNKTLRQKYNVYL